MIDLNSIEEADIPHCTFATLGATEKITLEKTTANVSVPLAKNMREMAGTRQAIK